MNKIWLFGSPFRKIDGVKETWTKRAAILKSWLRKGGRKWSRNERIIIMIKKKRLKQKVPLADGQIF